jgi:tetratricopeptide (TPR) repeat protein
MREYDLAIIDLSKAIEFNANFAEAYYDRALCFSMSNELALARLDLKYYLSLNENDECGQWELQLIDTRIEIERESNEKSSIS